MDTENPKTTTITMPYDVAENVRNLAAEIRVKRHERKTLPEIINHGIELYRSELNAEQSEETQP